MKRKKCDGYRSSTWIYLLDDAVANGREDARTVGRCERYALVRCDAFRRDGEIGAHGFENLLSWVELRIGFAGETLDGDAGADGGGGGSDGLLLLLLLLLSSFFFFLFFFFLFFFFFSASACSPTVLCFYALP